MYLVSDLSNMDNDANNWTKKRLTRTPVHLFVPSIIQRANQESAAQCMTSEGNQKLQLLFKLFKVYTKWCAKLSQMSYKAKRLYQDLESDQILEYQAKFV